MTSPTDPTWTGFDHAPDTYCAGTTRKKCPRDFTYPVEIGSLKAGQNTIRVDVWDRVGNLTSKDYSVYNAPTLVAFGGANRSVDTTDEIAAVREALLPLDDDAWGEMWDGLTPADQDRVIPEQVEDTVDGAVASTRRNQWHWGW